MFRKGSSSNLTQNFGGLISSSPDVPVSGVSPMAESTDVFSCWKLLLMRLVLLLDGFVVVGREGRVC